MNNTEHYRFIIDIVLWTVTAVQFTTYLTTFKDRLFVRLTVVRSINMLDTLSIAETAIGMADDDWVGPDSVQYLLRLDRLRRGVWPKSFLGYVIEWVMLFTFCLSF